MKVGDTVYISVVSFGHWPKVYTATIKRHGAKQITTQSGTGLENWDVKSIGVALHESREAAYTALVLMVRQRLADARETVKAWEHKLAVVEEEAKVTP